MKAKFLLLVVLCVMAVTVNAKKGDDKGFKIGIGGTAGIPTGDMSDVSSMAYGFDLKGEFGVAPKLAITVSAGYQNYILKSDFSGLGVDFGVIPVLGGLKYDFSDKVYGSAEVGLSFFTEKDAGNAFTFVPGVGYKVSDKFDLMLKYQTASKDGANFAFFGIRAGFTF